jgi:glutaryl-CoA dehydrogenase (non-decarboxylating)
MEFELTTRQNTDRTAFRAFVQKEIAPDADRYDQEERIPSALIQKLAQQGWLGALLPGEWGGRGMDMITFGLLHEEIGRGCSSVRSLLTVHSMVSHAIARWGSRQQKLSWLPRLATGDVIGAFGLSEPEVGSDASSVQATAVRRGDYYLLNGSKKWISFGQIANLFLIFARCEGKLSAFLVENNTPGLSTTPISGMLGVRASQLAELQLHECLIPAENLVGAPGFGLLAVAASALDIGRYSVAWGCVGIAQACLDASLRYTAERKQFDVLLKEHQLIKQMIAEMVTHVKAARLLCYHAGHLKDAHHPDAVMETWVAKYFASTTSTQAAHYAVQIHGANGCSSDYPVQRYFRDARIMEIIEGSTQIQQITIANYGYQGHE